MLKLLYLSLFGYVSFASCLTTDLLKFMNNSTNLFSTQDIQKFYMKSENDFVCTSQSLISDKTFTNLVEIKSDIGCQSITIIKCNFESISIPDSSQTNGQISLIYIKNSDLSIENSNFQGCTSKSKITLSIDNIPELDSLLCHAIFIDENINHKTSIDNCIFLNNGKDAVSDGTIIFSSNANNIEILSSQFKSDQAYTRAFQAANTMNIILTNNTFSKMTGPIGQNGGALLIQFANNVSISDSIFDSNTLQPNPTVTDSEVCGSAFYINLNDIFTFTNNTISNHENFLNSVITLNKNDNLAGTNERSIIISDSNFNNNKYTSSIDGSGIGFYAENLDNSNILNIIFNGCNFNENGDDTATNNAAGVFGWSKEASISFTDCNFKSNKVPTSSSLINIQNGRLVNFDGCVIEESIKYNFLKFSPINGNEENSNLFEIQVKISNTTITNTDLTNRVNSDLILIDQDTNHNSTLIIKECTFTDISLDQNNFVIHIQSNLDFVQISSTKISCNTQSQGSNLIKFQSSDINQIKVNDCVFQNSLFAISSDVNINSISIEDTKFTDCISDTSNIATIKINSNIFILNNCDIIFSSNANNACSMGILISNTKDVSIFNCSFKNCLGSQPGSAIRCLSQDDFETSLTVTSCTFDECTPNSNVYTTNRIVNFFNNTISCSNSNKQINGIFINYKSQILIDNCTFTKCKYTSDGSSIRYFPPADDQKVIEKVVIQNCDFVECAGRAAVISANPFDTHPKFINMTVMKSYHTFNFIIEPKQSTDPQPGEVLFQNATFIDNHPNGNVAYGGGGIGFWYKTTKTNEDTVSFIECHFEDTFYQGADHTLYGGGAICVQSNSCKNFYIKIISCTFKNCYTLAHNGGAVAITTAKTVQMENCYFEKCRIDCNTKSKYVGGAVFISYDKTDEVISFSLTNVTVNESIANTDFTAIDFECDNCDEFVVRDCNFINCKSKCDFAGSYNIISCPDGFVFECENTNFVFDEKSGTNPRAFQVHPSSFYIDNCTFIRCGSKAVSNGGAIYYDGTKLNEMISITNSHFEECDATKTAVFELRLNTYQEPVLFNNSIIRINSDYSINIEFKSSELRAAVLIREHNFIENVHSSKDGGGAGIGVSNSHNDEVYYGINFAIYDSNFTNNYSPFNGGAYGVGSTESVKSIELDIEDCCFVGNHCDGGEGGGALWIRTTNNCIILFCNFTDNYASESQVSNGGAIYLSFTSDLTTMSLNYCNFVNNSCPFPESHAHAVYSTLLYGCISISSSNFTDNGIEVNESNSVIYTRSELSVQESFFYFTDKEKAFSRAIYVGASSSFTLRSTTIANFSYPDGNGGALYYASISNRPTGRIDISDNTFINNTAGETGSEMFLTVRSSPIINNCSFIDESSENEIIAVICSDSSNFQSRFDRLYFKNCDFHYNRIYSTTTDDGNIVPESTTLYGCIFYQCYNVSLTFRNIYSLDLTDCVFDQIKNKDAFASISSIQNSLITNCQFRNIELIPTDKQPVNHTIVQASDSMLTISNTSIENCIVSDDDAGSSNTNCFVIKTDSNLALTGLSINGCPSFLYSVYYEPTNEIKYDEWLGTPIIPKLSIDNCIYNNSGAVIVQNMTDIVDIVNSVFTNSVDGLIYNAEMSSEGALFDEVQIKNNTFDGLTNRACFIIIDSDLNISNCTIKNCHCTRDDCPPIFEIEARNGLISDFVIDSFIFVNNSFNNNDKQRWINGGGTGFIVSLKPAESDGESTQQESDDFSLCFVDCIFISNDAVSNGGGAFAFFESTDSTEKVTFLTFDSCFFKGNSCKGSKGSALYLIAKNVSIINCVFDQAEKEEEEEGKEEESPAKLLEINDKSTVYLYFIPTTALSDKISDTFSCTNCSFVHSSECSIHIENSTRELAVTNCTFSANSEHSLFFNNCSERVTVSECLFESSKNDNNDSNDNYEIICYCSKSFIVDKTSFLNTCGIYILLDSSISDQIKVTNVRFENSGYGLKYESSNKASSKLEVLVENCIFLSVKHALMLSLLNSNLVLHNNSILNCSNLDDRVDKKSIIEITVNPIDESSFTNLIFDQIHFLYNQYLQPKASTAGFGGGIGLSVFQVTGSKKNFGIEFKDCEFLSNNATDGEVNHLENGYSGGAFYYADDSKLSLTSLSFENCYFVANYAAGKGGAVYIETGSRCSLAISNTSFYVNKANVDAAAVYVKNGFKFTLDSSTFVNNSVYHSAATSSTPTDSLVVVSASEATITSNLFIKSSYANYETNVQTFFLIEQRKSGSGNDQISIQIDGNQFSSINPSKSIVSLRSKDESSLIKIYNSSFTHFYLSTHLKSSKPPENRQNVEEEINGGLGSVHLLQIINESSNYFPIYIFDDSTGKFEIESSCFDTESIYTVDRAKAGFDDSSSSSQIQGQVSVNQNQVKSMDCYYPPVIVDLMKEIFDSTPTPLASNKSKDNLKYIIIGSVVGAVVVIMAVVIVVVILFIRKKRKKELEEKTKLEAEKTNEMNEENELINTKFIFATQAMTQENPLFTYANANHNNNNNNTLDNFYEESK